MKVCLVGTYPPTKCGIAEYTYELASSLRSKGIEVEVLAIDDGLTRVINYPPEVIFVVERGKLGAYRKAASYVNEEGIDLVCIQHEYGIFGGAYGNYVIKFMERLEQPIVTTLHTVIPRPDKGLKKVTNEILGLSDAVTVMSYSALRVLLSYYDISRSKIHVIPHGVRSPITSASRDLLKSSLGLSGHFVMLTIGLLSPNKGIEYAIMALPKIARSVDNVLYLVVGETHPKIKAMYGEAYRLFLIRLAKRFGVEDKVLFVDKFLTKEDYMKYILASDVVVLPYLDRRQVSSGALSYALSCGRAVVSTPFMYAEELLSRGGGILCRFRDPNSIADAVIRVATNPSLRTRMEMNALKCGRLLRWDLVSSLFISVFKSLVTHAPGGETHVPSAYAKIFVGTNG